MSADSKCTPPDILVCYRVKKNGSNNPTSNSANLNSNALANGLNNHQTVNISSLDPQTQANAVRQARYGPGGLPLKQSKSRELRASIMYTGCDCEKRNGLQDDCLRSECRGSPECLTKPNPICGPSEFSNGKHLELKRLQAERLRKAAQQDIPGSTAMEDTNTGDYAQLSRDNNDDDNRNGNNQGGKVKSKSARAANHPDDCCCCCCCGEVTYHCVQGISVDQTNDNQQPAGQGAARCPGTAECGPGICPVGQCPGGVYANGSNQKHNQKDQNQNNENLIPGGGRGDAGGSKTSCNCDRKGKLQKSKGRKV